MTQPLRTSRPASSAERTPSPVQREAIVRYLSAKQRICKTCRSTPWLFHRHSLTEYAAPSQSQPDVPHLVVLVYGVWRCDCTNAEFTRRGQEGKCHHIAGVKGLAEAGIAMVEATEYELFDEELDAPQFEGAEQTPVLLSKLEGIDGTRG